LRTNLLLTCTEAARRVGVASTLRLLAHARRGNLRIAGQTEDGHVLFREEEVLRAAHKMPPRDLLDPDDRDLPTGLLLCGCCFAPPIRAGENRPLEGEPEFLCREAQGLDMARRLAAAFAMAAPDDPFFRRLAAVTREAFERHIADPRQQNATAPPSRDGAQLLVSDQTPLSDCAPLRRHFHQTR
jgi:hypothetical protein